MRLGFEAGRPPQNNEALDAVFLVYKPRGKGYDTCNAIYRQTQQAKQPDAIQQRRQDWNIRWLGNSYLIVEKITGLHPNYVP